ncbi:hypothetical protein BJY04DRAFT_211539 [Aspergillus karnatakaensis]|uniref:uncharacterized protein n=1 Tax=Aspergillus karnatakaensis TaxID=1810916 RepID=UPI003CCD3FE6
MPSTDTNQGPKPKPKPKSRAKPGPSFIFVEARNSPSGRPQDEDAKAAIRRQAARSGRKHQQLQLQTPDPSRENSLAPGQGRVDDELPLTLTRWNPPLLTPQPAAAGYEALKVKYNFDITYLSPLTDIALGKLGSVMMQENPTLVRHLISQHDASFLSYLPSRYGSSLCLDAAIDCLAAAAGQMFGSLRPIRPASLSMLYGRALQSLQAALNDGSAYKSSEVYCATRLLTLYELISHPEADHHILHSRGGSRIVQLRGPKNHTTPFDYMLLKSQGPFIVVDAMSTSAHTILEAPEWQRVMEDASQAETDPDASSWWDLFAAIALMPGMVADMLAFCKRHVSHAPTDSRYFDEGADLHDRARRLRNKCHKDHAHYMSKIPHRLPLYAAPIAPESPDRIWMRLFYLTVPIQMCRAIATLSIDESERATAEAEAQMLVAQMLLILRTAEKIDPAMAFYFGQQECVPASVVHTRALFAPENEQPPPDEIGRYLADRWLKWQAAIIGFIVDNLN